jgi:membrane protein DedA with SNARE-associated domain
MCHRPCSRWVVAAATAWRWRRNGWPGRFAGAIAIALALYGAGVVHPPQLGELIGSVGSTLGPYIYALVAVMAFLEAGAFVGLLVPGETVVIAGGVVAGQGHVDVFALLGLTWICALGGDISGYILGRRLGRRFLLDHGARVHITEARLLRVEEFFARHGLATILIGRFVGLVRPVAPFLAGASRYPAGRFVALALVGTGLSCCWDSSSGSPSTKRSRSPSRARSRSAPRRRWRRVRSSPTASFEPAGPLGETDSGPAAPRPS